MSCASSWHATRNGLTHSKLKLATTAVPPLDDHEDGKPVLLSDRRAAERYDVSTRTLARWDETPGLGFPPVIYIKDRRYRSLAALEQWDRSLARRAATQGQVRGHGGRFKAADAGGAEADDLEATP